MALGIFAGGMLIDFILLSRIMKKPPCWRFLVKRIQARSWIWYDGAVILIAFLTLTLIISTATEHMPHELKHSPLVLLLQMVAVPITAICIIVLLLKSKRMSLRHGFGIKKTLLRKNLIQGAICYLAIMPFVMFASFVYMQILETLGQEIEYQPVIEMLVDPAYPIWIQASIILLAIISAPVIEEMIFRGIMLPLMLKKTSPLSAIFFVALLFAAVHAHIPAIIPIFILAVGLSLGYLATGSIAVPIVAHAIFNTVSITAFLLMKDMIL
jgi:membrane protease YdiL (CAAX protease family)